MVAALRFAQVRELYHEQETGFPPDVVAGARDAC